MLSKLRRPKSPPPTSQVVYLGETDGLSSLAGDETVIVLGELVIMNLDEPPNDGVGATIHVPQPTRELRRRDWSLAAFRNPPRRLYSSIHPLLADHIESHPRSSNFILAVDAMCALAATHQRTEALLIVNGYETGAQRAGERTHLDTYLFRFGQLICITESIIHKEKSHPRYAVDIKQQLDTALTDHPDAKVLWTAPLTPIDIPGYTLEYVGPEIYRGKFPRVTRDGQTTPPSPKIPAFATAGVLVACMGVGAVDIGALNQKRATYDALTQQNTSNPTIALEVLQARAKWQQETDGITPDHILSPATRLLAAISQNPEWHVTALSLATQRGTETAAPSIPPPSETAPLSVSLSIPMVPNISAIEQAQPVVAALNQRTGMKLIVKQQGLLTTAQDGRLALTIITDAQ